MTGGLVANQSNSLLEALRFYFCVHYYLNKKAMLRE